MRNAKGSAQSVWTVAIVKIEGSIPVRLKKRLVETPMLTPGMNSGNNITVTIMRGIPKLLTAWAAASPKRGAVIPTIAASKTEFDRYIAAFENADAAALKEVLREDAALEMVGSRTWFSGLRTCLPFITSPQVLGSPGDWRMVPTAANGQPAAAAYLRGDSGIHEAYGIAVLTPGTDGIARIVVFGDPELVTTFGFPVRLP